MWMHGAAGAPGAGHSPWPPGVAEWTAATGQKADIAVASLTNDDGEEARRWSSFIIQVGAEVAIADAPKTAELGPATAKLKSEGYSWEEVEVNSSELGDATSRYRRIVMAVKGGGEPTSLGQECVEPVSVRACVGKLRQEVVRLSSEEGSWTRVSPGEEALEGPGRAATGTPRAAAPRISSTHRRARHQASGARR